MSARAGVLSFMTVFLLAAGAKTPCCAPPASQVTGACTGGISLQHWQGTLLAALHAQYQRSQDTGSHKHSALSQPGSLQRMRKEERPSARCRSCSYTSPAHSARHKAHIPKGWLVDLTAMRSDERTSKARSAATCAICFWRNCAPPGDSWRSDVMALPLTDRPGCQL